MTSSPLRIRPMTPGDVPAAAGVLVAGGWPDRSALFAHLLRVPACQVVVGELSGRIVATGVATVCGTVGWVGTIFVDLTLRRRGYGQAVTEAVCERLEVAGCTSLALIASEYGRPIYERMGFRVDAWHRVYTATGATGVASGSTSPAASVRRATASDLAIVLELDRSATGSDRGALLRSAGVSVAECDGAIAGFLASIDPAWPAIISPYPDAAAALLATARENAAGIVHASVVGTDDAKERLLTEMGWEFAFTTPRMLRGPTIEWRPDLVWGILGLAFG